MFEPASAGDLVALLLYPRWKQVLWALLLDAALGDPRWLPHPVVGMGRLAALVEAPLRTIARGPAAQRAAGSVLVVMVAGTSAIAAYGAVHWLSRFSPATGGVLSVLLLYTALAHRSLRQHLHAVLVPLSGGDLPAARQAVARVVGRDTDRLDESEVARAAVETLAESTSDGIVAPLLYGLVGGAPLALTYKAVNTLDSMVGYRNEQYRYFGTAAARLDDLLNWVPARITALVMILAGAALGHPARKGWRTVVADARRHPSPNAGYPEAAMAGLLGLRLGGTNFYHGVPSRRPVLGSGGREPQALDIIAGMRIAGLTSWLTLILGAGIATLVWRWLS